LIDRDQTCRSPNEALIETASKSPEVSLKLVLIVCLSFNPQTLTFRFILGGFVETEKRGKTEQKRPEGHWIEQ
jgi:hypothetical protein